jgi:hypothetical protein
MIHAKFRQVHDDLIYNFKKCSGTRVKTITSQLATFTDFQFYQVLNLQESQET